MRTKARCLLGLAAVATASAGCLDEPEIEDRWTRVDIVEASVSPGQALTPGTPTTIDVSADVTFRSVLTGFVVAEVRVADSLSIGDTILDDPDAKPEDIAADVDRILASSVTAGRATRAITGWDHLIFPVELTFDATVPDSLGTNGGVFFVTYLGEGEEVEREDGSDTLIVTPFLSTDYEVLHSGYELRVGGTAP